MATNAHCRLLTNFVQQLHIHAHSEVQPASNNAIIRVVMQMTGDTGIPIYSHNHLGKARNFCQTFSSAARIAKASRSLISSMIMHCGVRIVFCDRMYVFKAHLVYCSVNALMTSQHWVNLQKIKTASLSCSLWVRTSQYLSFSKRMPSYWASKTYEFRRSVSRGFHHRRPVCLIVMSCDSKHSTTNICDYQCRVLLISWEVMHTLGLVASLTRGQPSTFWRGKTVSPRQKRGKYLRSMMNIWDITFSFKGARVIPFKSVGSLF